MWFNIIGWFAIWYTVLSWLWIAIIHYRRRQARQRALKLLAAKTTIDLRARSTRNRNLHKGTVADQSAHHNEAMYYPPEDFR